MSDMNPVDLAILIGVSAVLLLTLAAVFLFYVVPESGRAFVRTGFGRQRVGLDGMFIVPGLHRLIVVDLTSKRLTLHRFGSQALQCGDGVVADAKLVLRYRVDRNPTAIRAAAHQIALADDAEDTAVQDELLDRLNTATQHVVSAHDFRWLYENLDAMRSEILRELCLPDAGLVVDELAIDHFAQPAEADLPEDQGQSNGKADRN